jgi:8-oxo-dGTP diphosphatase
MVIQIAAALVRDSRVLMVHRHPQRLAYPDSWGLSGGHVETGESPRDAVIRECQEEIGVQIHDALPLTMVVDDPNVRMHAFLVTQWTGEPHNIAPEEHDDLRWFSTDELMPVKHAHPEALPDIIRAIQMAADS